MRSATLTLPVSVLALAVSAPAGLALTADHRLGREVVPTFQSVHLNVDAGKPDYTGSTRIELRVDARTDSLQLHARGMTLERVALAAGRREIPTTFAPPDEHGVLTVRAAEPLRPGRYALEIDFTNDFSTRANSMYRLETGGEAYVFTQFQATAAREAFPCWDEPEFKIPWQLTLVVPAEHLALSNAPILAEKTEGGRRRVTFERTPPMPSYLVAIATGPLETVPIPGLSVPGRIVAVKGSGRLTTEAARWTPPILAALEKYFGRRYPYRKLDLLAVPEFWPGAMENPGAVTFRDRILLLDPAAVTADERRRLVTVLAHELAHMWFGDLVTMRWWDDLWLNESFASWMGDKVSHEVAPELEVPLAEVRSVQRAMTMDARLSTRTMRGPVDAFDNLDRLADALAYDKGQALLGMLEQWVGEDAFRQGVRRYIARHAWGSAVGSDLWNALAKASGHDVAGVAASFLDQPGIPLVEVETTGTAEIRLRQRRFLAHGVQAPAPARWRIPVALRYSDGSRVRTRTVLLADSVQSVTLEAAGSLTWLHPNADERGYYRWQVPSGTLLTLVERAGEALAPRERVGLAGNLVALLGGGAINGDEALRMLARLAGDPHPQAVTAVVDALDGLRGPFLTAETRDAFAAYVRRTLGPALERIGAARSAGEPDAASLLRPRLLFWLGLHGEDAEVVKRAREMSVSYLFEPASVDPSLAETALGLAAASGDLGLFEAFRRRFEDARLPADRERFLGALGAFRDSALVTRALDYALEGPLRPQELFTIPRRVASLPEHQDRVFEWLTRNWARITGRVPPVVIPFTAYFCAGCSAERLAAGLEFFADPARRAPGIGQELARVEDQVRECVRLREREGEAVARYLGSLASAR